MTRLLPLIALLLPTVYVAAEPPVACWAANPPPAAQETVNDASTWGDLTNPLRETAMQTLGGRLFWGDVLFFRGWRIQQNVLTEHFRLLDPADRRFATGTRADCLDRLNAIKREQNLEPMRGKAVVLIHGMGRSAKVWTRLKTTLEAAGATVVAVNYPSTRSSIANSAEYLAQVLDSLDGIDQIDIVAHSMGGLVTRAFLLKHSDPRIGRLVMLAVPNRGAELADHLAAWPAFQMICGPGGCELVSDPAGLIATLPTPDFEFAVIAGGRGTAGGYNPLIPGDDDGTVTVASTRLPGAADFLQIDGVLHSFVVSDPRSVAATVRFLETGRLRADGDAQPIPRTAADTNR